MTREEALQSIRFWFKCLRAGLIENDRLSLARLRLDHLKCAIVYAENVEVISPAEGTALWLRGEALVIG